MLKSDSVRELRDHEVMGPGRGEISQLGAVYYYVDTSYEDTTTDIKPWFSRLFPTPQPPGDDDRNTAFRSFYQRRDN